MIGKKLGAEQKLTLKHGSPSFELETHFMNAWAIAAARLFGVVKLEQTHSSTPWWSQPDNRHIFYGGKMFRPLLRPGVKKKAESTSLGVERTEVCSFISVAPPASKCEVVRIGSSPMLQGNYRKIG